MPKKGWKRIFSWLTKAKTELFWDYTGLNDDKNRLVINKGLNDDKNRLVIKLKVVVWLTKAELREVS